MHIVQQCLFMSCVGLVHRTQVFRRMCLSISHHGQGGFDDREARLQEPLPTVYRPLVNASHCGLYRLLNFRLLYCVRELGLEKSGCFPFDLGKEIQGNKDMKNSGADIEQERSQAREQLRGEVVKLALLGAEQVLDPKGDAAGQGPSKRKSVRSTRGRPEANSKWSFLLKSSLWDFLG